MRWQRTEYICLWNSDLHHMPLPCFSLQKNTQQNVTRWWSINKNSLCKMQFKCLRLMSKSPAHLPSLSSEIGIPTQFLVMLVFFSRSLPLMLVLYLFLYPSLTSYVCSLSDRFGCWFREWKTDTVISCWQPYGLMLMRRKRRNILRAMRGCAHTSHAANYTAVHCQ